MDLSTANVIAGGIIFGVLIFILALIILSVGGFLYKKEKITESKGIKRISLAVGATGIVISIISCLFMIFTGSTDNVSTIFATMRSDKQAIYNDKMYVKTDFLYNGGKNKYNTKKAEDILSGAGELYTLAGYNKYNVLVKMNSNVTGVIFVCEDEKSSFEKYYGDYKNNYNTGALFDTHNKKMTSVKQEAEPILYSKIVDWDNYKETKEENVTYADKITSTKNCIFWATSKDNLVTSQITIYPKDKQGKFIRFYEDKYYQLDKSLTKEIEKYFK